MIKLTPVVLSAVKLRPSVRTLILIVIAAATVAVSAAYALDARAESLPALLMRLAGLSGGAAVNATSAPAAKNELGSLAPQLTPLTGDLAIGRSGHTATRLSDGRVLVAGGDANGTAEIYDPATDSFSATGSLGAARSGHTASLLNDGRVLIIGGTVAGSAVATTEIFDPSTGTFSPSPSTNAARSGQTATTLGDGRVVVIAGDASGSIEIYDPLANSFSTAAVNVASPRSGHAAALLQNGNILVVGGTAPDGSNVQTGEIVNLANSSVSTVSNTTEDEHNHALLRLLSDGKVQIIGGTDHADMEIYDPAINAFGAHSHVFPIGDSHPELVQQITDAPTRAALFYHGASGALLDREGHTITELPASNKALVVGGTDSTGAVLSSSSLLPSSPASITTDKLDYAPGTPVVVTGTGFAANETVTLTFHEDPHPDTENPHTFTVTTDANGNFTDQQYAPEDSDVGISYVLAAVGGTSAYTAQTALHDSGGAHIISVTLGPQTGTLTAGASGSATFLVTVTNDDNGSNTATLSLNSTLPTGVTGSFSPSTLNFSTANHSPTSTLTFTTTAASPAGNYPFSVTATGTNSVSSNVFTFTINKADTTTAITTDTPDPSVVGQSVAVNYSVTRNPAGGGTITGNVTVNASSGESCVGTVAAGTCSITFNSAGAKTLTAVYGGDTNFNGSSTSSGTSHAVNKADTTTVIASNRATPVQWNPTLSTNLGPSLAQCDADTVSDGAGRLIAFARAGCLSGADEVWVLNGANGQGVASWSLVSNSLPVTRHAQFMAYDRPDNKLIIFGGCTGGCLPVLNDVWVLSNANGQGGPAVWTQLSPSGVGPAPRQGGAAAYDPATNRLILFGGQNGGGGGGDTFPEVWALTNANGTGGTPVWNFVGTQGPFHQGQYHPVVSYDSANNRLTVLGGQQFSSGNPSNAVDVLTNANGVGGTPQWSNLIPEGTAGAPFVGTWHSGLDQGANRLILGVPSTTTLYYLSNVNGLGGATAYNLISPAGGTSAPYSGLGFDSATGRVMSWNQGSSVNSSFYLASNSATTYGQSVTFTATVNATSPGSGTPTGTVQFMDGATPIGVPQTLSGGTASVATTGLPVGMHVITAAYSGDTNFNVGSNGFLPHTVSQASTTSGFVNWNPLSPTGGGPGQGMCGPSTFGDGNGRMIVFGQPGCSGLLQTWVLDGANGNGSPAWTQVSSPDFGPAARHGQVAAYDSSNNRLITFGGCTGGCTPVANDVWVRVNANGQGGLPFWIQVMADTLSPSAPAQRQGGTGAYDPISNRLIIFGGQDGGANPGSTFQDVWVLTNANGLGGTPQWIQLSTAGTFPLGQYGTRSFYDPVTNRLTVVGGATHIFGAQSTAVNVLLNANGLGGTPTWVNLIADGAPGSIVAFGVPSVYDAANNRALLATGPGSELSVLANVNGLGGTTAYTHIAPRHGSAGISGMAFDVATGRTTALYQNGSANLSTVLMPATTDSSNFGEPVTFTAKIDPVSPGSGAGSATGTVTFNDGFGFFGSANVVGGYASITTSTLSAGVHNIVISYSGDSNFGSSISSTLTHTVNKAVTATTVTSSVNPTTYGGSTTFTSTTLSGGNPVAVGTVLFIDGTNCASPGSILQAPTNVNANGQVSFSTSALTPPSHTIAACYTSSSVSPSNFADSNGSVVQTVNKATLNVTADNRMITFGSADPFFSFQYSGFIGSDGPTSLNTQPFCTVSGPHANVGTYPIVCSGGVSNNYAFNYVNGTLTVIKANQAITFAPLADKTYGDAPFTVSATGGASGNPVTFAASGNCSASGTNGTTITITTPAGCTVTASQAGNSNYNAAPDVQQSFAINKAGTASVVTSSENPSFDGNEVTFTATVTRSQGAAAPTGTVDFKDGATVLGSGTLDAGGHVAFTASALSVATHSITAVYSGDSNYSSSTSPILNQIVSAAACVLPNAPGGWSARASVPAAYSGTGLADLNGTLYAVGGLTSSGCGAGEVKTVQAYDASTNTWTPRAPMNTARQSLGVASLGGKLYAVGGATGCGVGTTAVEVYDPSTNAWSMKAPLPVATYALKLASVNGKLYAIGGQTNGTSFANVFEYDPTTDHWTTKAPLPAPRTQFGLAMVNGLVYVSGGYDGPAIANATDTLFIYDPSTDTWSTGASLPLPRIYLGSAGLNGKVYVYGGSTTSVSFDPNVESYDPATNSWSVEPSMLTGRQDFGHAASGGKLYAVGGQIAGGANLTSVEAYTPSSLQGMIAWYPGNGNTNEVMGGNNGTLHGGGYSQGKVNNAFNFSGAPDNYVLAPSSPALQISSAITVDAWINPASTAQIGGAGIVAKGSFKTGAYAFDILPPETGDTGGRLRFFFYDNTPDHPYQVIAHNWLTADKVGTWHHIAATYDSITGSLLLYDNGVLIATPAPEDTPAAGTVIGLNNHELSIGSRQSAGTDNGSGTYDWGFNGGVDEVEIFNRALSASEIKSIFDASFKGKCNTAPIAADQSVTTNAETPLPITLSATDAEGNFLTYAVTSGPSHGTLTGTAPNLTYTPAAGYFGPDSFKFKANDGFVDSNEATVSIDVHCTGPTASTNPSAVTLTYGDSMATFTAAATGVPTPSIKWQVSTNGGTSFTPLSDGGNYTGTASNTLTITLPTVAQSGSLYRAEFSSTCATADSAPALLTVHPKTLTAAIIGNPTKVYDANTVATLAPANFSVGGTVGSESFTVNQTVGTYGPAADAGSKTVSATLSPANFVAGSGTSAANYSFPTTATGTGTIAAAATSLNTTAVTGTYGGTVNLTATLTRTSAPAGVLSGKTVNFTLNGKAVGSAVSDAAGIASLSSVYLTSDGTSSGTRISAGSFTTGVGATFATENNYTGSSDTDILTVQQKSVTANVTASNKVYDGTDSASVTCSPFGTETNDDLTCQANGPNTFDNRNAGTGKTVTARNIILGGTSAANYALTATTSTTTADILTKGITATLDAADKVYDGSVTEPNANMTCAFSGVIATDTTNVACTPSAGSFNFKDVSTANLVTATVTIGGTEAANYTLGANGTFVNSTSAADEAHITQRILTAAIIGGPTKPYDGNATAILTPSNFALMNLVGGEGFTVTQTVGMYNSANVAGATSVTATLSAGDFTPSGGADATNYVLPTIAAGAGSITQRPATWTTSPASKTYGDADPDPLTTGAGTNFVDTVSATYSRVAGEQASPPTYHITATLNAAPGVLDNYIVTNTGADFTITKRHVEITADAKSKTYGDADPALTYHISAGSLAFADAFSGSLSRAPGETVGNYLISQNSVTLGGNYDLSYVAADLTIQRKTASVTPDASGKIYGDGDPSLTGTLNGFLAGDGVTAVYSRTAGDTVGPYTISATLSPAGVLGNYDIAYNTATFTIDKRSATWTTNNNAKIYFDSDPSPLTGGSGSNFVAGDGISAAYTRAAGESVGIYHITANLSSSVAGALNNYNITNTGATFTISNTTPSNLVVSGGTINENGSATVSGTFVDPDPMQPHTVTIAWNDAGASSILNLAAGTFAFSAGHQYLDDNPTATPTDNYPVSVTVTDGADTASGGSTVIVNNVAPSIDSFGGVPATPISAGSAVSLTANFSDIGTKDTHTCSINWDDGGSPVPGTIAETNGSGTCSASKTFSAPGVYTVMTTVTDDDTGTVTAGLPNQYIVVYDPSAGFVTGGGWINSPVGACKLDWCTDATVGKANFGFVSKYKKGSSTPDGQTEFQFQAGNLNFHSSAYDAGSLVVSGYKAQYKGTGDINGVTGYRFVLTAYDGNVSGGGGIDKFRMKIIRVSDNKTVYDNVMGASDDIDSANPMALGGGSINIQKN